MKRIFYRLEEDLYFDWDGFLELIQGEGLKPEDLEGVPVIKDGRPYSNTLNHFVHVN